jgi:hypothetical protein
MSTSSPCLIVPSASSSTAASNIHRIDNSRGAKNASTNFKEWQKRCSAVEPVFQEYVVLPHHPSLQQAEVDMGFGRGVLFWLLGIPIPIIILLALFWHH